MTTTSHVRKLGLDKVILASGVASPHDHGALPTCVVHRKEANGPGC